MNALRMKFSSSAGHFKFKSVFAFSDSPKDAFLLSTHQSWQISCSFPESVLSTHPPNTSFSCES